VASPASSRRWRSASRQVDAARFDGCLLLRQAGFGLFHRVACQFRVQADQQLALLHRLPQLHMHGAHLAGDLRADIHLVPGHHQADGEHGLFDVGQLSSYGGRLGCGFVGLPIAPAEGGRGPQCHKSQPQQKIAPAPLRHRFCHAQRAPCVMRQRPF
jgi:hypothetical protein